MVFYRGHGCLKNYSDYNPTVVARAAGPVTGTVTNPTDIARPTTPTPVMGMVVERNLARQIAALQARENEVTRRERAVQEREEALQTNAPTFGA